MKLSVRRFRETDRDPIARLNRRLAEATAGYEVFLDDLSGNPEGDLEKSPIVDRLFVVADGQEIRGGVWLREQRFWIRGNPERIGWIKYPVAESLIDRRFVGVPAAMVFQLLREQPRLMALGMGGHDAPFARLLHGAGWERTSIPLFFLLLNPFRVLRGLAYARKIRWRRVLMDAMAFTGIGSVSYRALRGARRLVPPWPSDGLHAVVEADFSVWADEVWMQCRDAYEALAVRDARALDSLYYDPFPGLARLRVTRRGQNIGWVCTQELRVKDPDLTPYFGTLRPGLITDALAKPADALDVLSAGVQHLRSRGVDLILAHFTHSEWIRGARALGFFPGPSNVAFYQSGQAHQALAKGSVLSDGCHFTRSDGDGPKR